MKPTQSANLGRVNHQTYVQAMTVIIGLIAISANADACEKPVVGRPIAVATPAAAIAAAKEAWKSIYSKAPQHSAFSPESIAQGEPYVATLENGVWRVVGTLPKGTVGGTPEASICAVDGSVSATSHGR
ncbi:MAG: NTF2 fold immunity protein [Steroidobacteraceae bacterium]